MNIKKILMTKFYRDLAWNSHSIQLHPPLPRVPNPLGITDDFLWVDSGSSSESLQSPTELVTSLSTSNSSLDYKYIL